MSLDIVVVLLYAASMLALGWYGMHRARTSEEYLIAGRNLGPWCYMGTMASTVLGGACTVGTMRLGYVYGISGVWLCATLGLGIIALNLFLAKPLLKLKIFTVTQVLERRYNAVARQASAAIMLAYSLMIGVISTLAMGTVLQVLFEWPFLLSILCGGGVVVAYSSIGGMWSLTLTDIVQFVIKTVGLMFILLPICLYRVGAWDALMAQLPASAFSFTAMGYDTIISYFLIYFFGILIGQDIWQRVFTARSEHVAKYAGSAAGVYCVIYGLVCAVIGMCARVIIPDLTDPNNTFAAITQTALPPGIRGLVIAAALAAMMSTASAGLLAASTVLTQDLLPTLRNGKASSLSMNRWCTALTGLAVLAIACVVTDVLGALTLTYNLLVAGMLIPLVGAIYWKRATTAGAIASMSLGFATALVFMIKDGLAAASPIYYGLSVGLVSFVVVSLAARQPVVATQTR
ncbi:sodium:solute symporter [Pseudomonas kermanshahensis]|uniref:Sodium:solute symporter n=1 Tax=Pseudomonas kermanshahensis TaxID=2745482 RepID=A0ABU8RCS0_9PSED|nr:MULTISPECIES: sodium:solute symporter [Pseudomonas]MBC3486461.1 sodium:solute symporter [Pseudomonas sp. SWRI50]MBC3496749.1 sodium:solute symporter [Pseudomonas sp. SWRI67]MBV4526190.1 sodium:solute symporter [Pseudomonas kermanshahensis]